MLNSFKVTQIIFTTSFPQGNLNHLQSLLKCILVIFLLLGKLLIFPHLPLWKASSGSLSFCLQLFDLTVALLTSAQCYWFQLVIFLEKDLVRSSSGKSLYYFTLNLNLQQRKGIPSFQSGDQPETIPSLSLLLSQSWEPRKMLVWKYLKK